jgi:hypothetical protein
MAKLASSSPMPETVPFATGCEFLRISTRTATRLLKDPAADFPPVFRVGRGHGKQFFRSLADLQRWLDRKAARAAVDRGMGVASARLAR